ncbi:Rieske (2Fe-2S) protein [Parafrankia discariae]|uniref:Rieske (2Fe-2S) protein n=1 Tax=Parafrankia discariae TaxID=365528 RepID=UPI00037D0E1A|nr:Rieske 2Fe-2S domain-containing protein [Parafrankia discariae]
MKAAEIPAGEGRAVVVGDEQVAVFRLRDGTLRALSAACPHRGGPLADGLIDDNVVVCPLHGLTYDLRTGAETSDGGPCVSAYTVDTDSDGELVVKPKDDGESRVPDSGRSSARGDQLRER